MEENRFCYISIQSAAKGANDGEMIVHSRKERSISPSPRFERNLGFFHMLSHRFGLRSHDDLIYSGSGGGCGGCGDDDARSSSTDSCSSTTGSTLPLQSSSSASASTKDVHGSSMEFSCASSDTSSSSHSTDDQQQHRRRILLTKPNVTSRSTSRLHRRSTSSIRRAFENISISTRSLSSSSSHTLKENISSKSTIVAARQPPPPPSSSSSKENKKRMAKKGQQQPTSQQRILRQPVSYTYLKGMSGLPTQRVPRTTVCCQNYGRR